jgi:hypothetical protein
VKRRKDDRPVPNSNEILSYFHCMQCLTDPALIGTPLREQYLEVGWTMLGLQVWCRRHEINVVHIDFEGHQHPANVTAARGGLGRFEH